MIKEILSIIMVLISSLVSPATPLPSLSSNISSSLGINATAEMRSGSVFVEMQAMPDALVPALIKAVNIARNSTGRSQITGIGYVNFMGRRERAVIVELNESGLTIEDARSRAFRAESDLAIYDFIPVEVDGGSTIHVKAEYAGRPDEFEENMANAVFNIFEDLPESEKIQFEIGNVTVEFSRDEVFNENTHQAGGCAPTKEQAYKEFVVAYNNVTKYQQENRLDLAKEAYEIYLQKKECYNSFS